MNNQITLGILTIIASLFTPLINLFLLNKEKHSQINGYLAFFFDEDYKDFKTATMLSFIFPIPYIIFILFIMPFTHETITNMFVLIKSGETKSISYMEETLGLLKLQYFANQVGFFVDTVLLICFLFILILIFMKKFKEINMSICKLITLVFLITLPILLFIISPTKVELIHMTKLNLLELSYYLSCSLALIAPFYIYLSSYYFEILMRMEHCTCLTLKDGYEFKDILDISYKSKFLTITVPQNYYFKKYTIPIDNVKYIEKLYVDKPIELPKLKKGKA